jgi:hypothetical protein
VELPGEQLGRGHALAERDLMSPILIMGTAYQPVKSALMRAEYARMGKSSEGIHADLIARLNKRIE